jgi:hypothetical protein
MDLSLVVFDTDRIKEYVFATGKLAEIRGASALLEELNLQETELTVQRECSTAKKVYCAGGSALFEVPTAEAARIITTVEALYRGKTLTATISGAPLPYDDGRPNEYGEQVREAFQELRRVKDQKPSPAHVTVAPWFHVCNACGQHPARHEDGDQLICAACHSKRESGRVQRSIFWKGFQEAALQAGDLRWRDNQLPDDLDDIGDVASPPGYVGFLYADANNMGKILQTLRTREDYERFAVSVDRLTRDVVHQALRHHAEPHLSKQREVAPFEILLMGGDDLILVTAADLAVSVALDIVKQYEVRAPQETGHDDLTLSLGLVLAHAHFPIYAMHDLAADLLKSAKKVGGSALDFAVVTAAGSRDLKWLRDEVLTHRSFARPSPTGWHYRLTQRPYRLQDFERLCRHARQFQAVRFPRGQLQSLYDGLFVSNVEASLRTITVAGRASRRHGKTLLDFLAEFSSPPNDVPPWRQEKDLAMCFKPHEQPQKHCFSTALGDLVELYRFVPALEEGEEHASSN